jgi:large repetitive protein
MYFQKTQTIALLMFAFMSFFSRAQQLPECGVDVPIFILDLTANPDSTYTTPEIVRTDQCCGGSGNDNYVSFYVTLHPDVAMVEIGIAPGYADPFGSGFYNIISGGNLITPGACGPDIPGGSTTCITGVGPHKIVYHKPGKNKVKYYLKQIPRPIFPQNDTTRVGCSLPLNIYGLNNIAITSINSSTGNMTPGAYNNLLSCVNCPTPSFSPGAGTPAWIDYQICGIQQASTACGIYQSCDTVRLYTRSRLTVSATPNPGEFCTGGSVLLTATANGGDLNYTYNWYDESLNIIQSGNQYTADTQGDYMVEVLDGLVSPTCPAEYLTIPVNEGLPPTVDAGITQTVCATNPSVFLSGSVSNASGGIWSGGSGSFSPNNTSLLTVYTPSASEIGLGSVTLTLTSTGAGGGCLENSDQITINFSDTVQINTSFLPILCNGGTTLISASASGGLGSYSYDWSTGSTSSSVTVSAGTYTLYVHDSLNCPATAVISVNQPSQLALNLSSVQTTSDLACDGEASVAISGGTGPYSVLWDDPLNQTTLTATGLCYGAYNVLVTDNNGCTITSSVVVNNPSCASFDLAASNSNVSCYGGADALAFSFPSGGSSPYSFSWNTSPVQLTQNASGLEAGTYTVTATDFNGCIQMASVTVTQPTVITNTMTHTDVTSIGGTNGTATANPQGGTPDIRILGYQVYKQIKPLQT